LQQPLAMTRAAAAKEASVVRTIIAEFLSGKASCLSQVVWIVAARQRP
jgi:hypothetical protein